MSRWWFAAVVGVVTVAVVMYGLDVPGALTDLKVYRAGGAAWLHGVPLYTDGFPFWLPFTYPPVSGVLFGVLAVLPFAAAAALLTVLGLVGLSVTTMLAMPDRVASPWAAQHEVAPPGVQRELAAPSWVSAPHGMASPQAARRRVAAQHRVAAPFHVAAAHRAASLRVVPRWVAARLAMPRWVAAPVSVPYWVVASLAVVAGLAFEPVRTTLMFGQVNLVLMGLVAFDCLMPRTRYPRGLLVGLAAAVKLTPAVFVLFFMARRQVQPAVTAGITFVAATGAGMLFAPADSLRYWYATIFDPDRIGGAEFVTNQSLRGALTRLGVPDVGWLVLAVVVLALAWRGARQAAEPVVALLVVAAAGLVVSPVSWSHHWVWVVPAVAVFAHRPRLLAAAAVFVVGQRFLPHGHGREWAWTWWQHLLGNSYVLVALAFLVWRALPEGQQETDRGRGGRDERAGDEPALQVGRA